MSNVIDAGFAFKRTDKLKLCLAAEDVIKQQHLIKDKLGQQLEAKISFLAEVMLIILEEEKGFVTKVKMMEMDYE